MAVSCYNCEYLRNMLEEQFILIDGDQRWIDVGIAAADRKLQMCAGLNEILAHRPWTTSEEILKEYLENQTDPELKWTHAELI